MMTRKDFLVRIFSGGALMGFGCLMRQKKGVVIYRGYVAGLGYYDGPRVIRAIKEGTAIFLRRESTNVHDARAIEVVAGNGKLGYIRQADNQVLSNLLDAEIGLTAQIISVSPEAEDWKKVKIEVLLNS